ncbi:pseudouridine synthase deg1 [Conoideocrella luteorostrata]|uniref:Pseudouridine synthase deg1 n=1 Tax=Conoideocrella luteorostrata TaxID=1105319 RepID=A0AAJ0CPW4_9HYPO|nr:pseudouridine synthase deg1 [Conoideocrella luteorostrata]
MQPLRNPFGRSVSARAVVPRVSNRPYRLAFWCRTYSVPAKKLEQQPPPRPRRKFDPHFSMSSEETNYNSWTKTSLIQRLRELEGEIKRRPEGGPSKSAVASEDGSQTAAAADGAEPGRVQKVTAPPKGKGKGKRKMDPSRYSSRFIALKLAYLGKNYGGFEFQAMGNQSSIEEELWKALTKACLIFPEDERVVQFDCCDYSKCGRTDRGVSAFGQVIGLRVRSNKPLPTKRIKTDNDFTDDDTAITPGTTTREEVRAAAAQDAYAEASAGSAEEQQPSPFDDLHDELCYPRILNRLLPDDIRILAWCPSPPPDFSARFSCRERQYRYFFTQPAFAPRPSSSEEACSNNNKSLKTGWLDIDAMRDAAGRFQGDNDFRNFCKIDPAKQITNFRRRIFEADIVEVKDAASALPYLTSPGFNFSAAAEGIAHTTKTTTTTSGPFPKVYYFHVRGSAFLWHQIRHMVAILFLVGQGLEPSSVVSELLDTNMNRSRPSYVMADEVPLVLWDCIFPDLSKEDYTAAEAPAQRTDCMEWIYVGEEYEANKFGQFGVMDSVWHLWRGHKIDELLSGQLLQLISGQGKPRHNEEQGKDAGKQGTKKADMSARVFEGGNSARLGGRYVPVMKKELLQSPEEQNDRYAKRKGFADAADMRAQRFGGPKEEEEEEGE